MYLQPRHDDDAKNVLVFFFCLFSDDETCEKKRRRMRTSTKPPRYRRAAALAWVLPRGVLSFSLSPRQSCPQHQRASTLDAVRPRKVQSARGPWPPTVYKPNRLFPEHISCPSLSFPPSKTSTVRLSLSFPRSKTSTHGRVTIGHRVHDLTVPSRS